jgi:hypothetical protein
MISYQALTDEIILFYTNHMQVKKVGCDFKEQLFNFATKDEKYPIVYIVPVDSLPQENVTMFTLEIYCFDIIQKDRANITTILSDCHQILNDLYLNYTLSLTDTDFDVEGLPSFVPLNNDLLDYAAGWLMTITFVLPSWTDCQIPKQIGN